MMDKVKKHRKTILLSLLAITVLLVVPNIAFAGELWQGALFLFVSTVIYAIASALGGLINLAITMMLFVATYNNFLEVPAVDVGWKIIRDLCNNFFIVILMVSAVSTVLKIQKYHYKAILSKLLLMAVLINFSKMFTGLLIDFSQVLMLMFAREITSISGRNVLLNAIGLQKGFKFNEISVKKLTESGDGLGLLDVITALLLVMIVGTVAIVVILMITVILVYRIVMFWFLVIMSPFAYLASTFPPTQGYSGKWWSNLFKYLAVGPAMMFFLYLSFFTMNKMASNGEFNPSKGLAVEESTGGNYGRASINASSTQKIFGDTGVTLSELAKPEKLFSVLISIAMMIGSLIVAQDLGVKGSEWGKKGIDALKNGAKGKGIVAAPWKAVGRTALTVGGAAPRAFGSWVEGKGIKAIATEKETAEREGRDPNKTGTFKKGLGTLIAAPGRISHAWVADSKSSLNKARAKVVDNFMKKNLGMGDKTMEAIQQAKEVEVGGQSVVQTTIDVASATAAGAGTALLAAPLGMPWLATKAAIMGSGLLGGLMSGGGQAIQKKGKAMKGAGHDVLGTGIERLGAMLTELNIGKYVTKVAKDTTLDKRNADKRIENIRKDEDGLTTRSYIEDSSKRSVMFSGDSYGSAQKNWAKSLSNNPEAVKELEACLNGSGAYARGGIKEDSSFKSIWNRADDSTKKRIKQNMEAMAKSMAAAKKEDDINSNQLAPLAGALDSLSSGSGKLASGPYKIKQVDEYADDIIKSRNVNAEDREMHEEVRGVDVTKDFALGDSNMMGVDFRNIKDVLANHGVEIDESQQGLHLAEDLGDKYPEVQEAIQERLQELVQNEIDGVKDKIENGPAEEKSGYEKKLAGLETAQERLSDSDTMGSLSLQNRALKTEGNKKELKRTVIHEDLHDAGLDNEEKAEEFSHQIESRHLRSLTKDIGKVAAEMEANGEEYDFQTVLEEVRARKGSGGRIDEVIRALDRSKRSASLSQSAGSAGEIDIDMDPVLEKLEEIEKNTESIARQSAIGSSGSSDGGDGWGPGGLKAAIAGLGSSLKGVKGDMSGMLSGLTNNRLDIKVTTAAVRGAVESAGGAGDQNKE